MAAPPQSPGLDGLTDLVAAFQGAPESLAFWPLAQGRLAEGRIDEAIDLLRHGLRLHPGHLAARLALARSLLARADWSEASAELVLVVAAEPDNADAHVLLAEALDAAGDASGARSALERACSLAPEDEMAGFLLEQAREQGRRRLGKVPLGKRRAGAPVVQERRRRRDARGGEDDAPSRPPRPHFRPEEPFAPLPEAEAAHSSGAGQRASAEGSEPPAPPRRPRSTLSGAGPSEEGRAEGSEPPASPRPSERSGSGAAGHEATARSAERSAAVVGAAPARSRARRSLVRVGIGVAVGVLGLAAGLAYTFRDRGAPALATAHAPRPPELGARLLLGRPADYRAILMARSGAATPALVAEARALALLDYGDGDPAVVEEALARAASAEPGEAAAALALARAALAVARLPVGADGEELAQARAALRVAADRRADAGLVQWLVGVVAVVAGDREAARAAFTLADARGTGPVHAALALADLQADEGDAESALAGYEAALRRAPGHPWALVGRARVVLEQCTPVAPGEHGEQATSGGGAGRESAPGSGASGGGPGAGGGGTHPGGGAATGGPGAGDPGRGGGVPAAGGGTARPGGASEVGGGERLRADLEAAAGATDGRRIAAWVALLRTCAGEVTDEGGADPGPDPRLVAARALLLADRGDLTGAARLRARLGAADPALVAPLEATLLLARGRPAEARAALGQRTDRRARFLRALAWIDDGDLDQAAAELRALRRLGADEDVVALQALLQVRAGTGRKAALATLEIAAGSGRHGLAQLALGEAYLADGNEVAARRALTGVTGAFGHRAAVRRAELELAAHERTHDPRLLADADTAAREALEKAPDYLPARAIVGRILVATGQTDGALAAFGPVVAAGRAGPLDELALAEAYRAAGEMGRARDAVRAAARKGAAPTAVRAVAEKIDRRFAEQLAAGR